MLDNPAVRYCVFDLETGGFSGRTDALVSVAAVRLDGDLQEVDRYACLVADVPGRRWTERAMAVNGLTPERCAAEGTPVAAVLAELQRRLRGTIWVAYNLAFDQRYLVDRGLQVPEWGVCPLLAARRCWPGLPNDLDAVAARLGIDRSLPEFRAHAALGDVLTLAEVLRRMVATGRLRLPPLVRPQDRESRIGTEEKCRHAEKHETSHLLGPAAKTPPMEYPAASPRVLAGAFRSLPGAAFPPLVSLPAPSATPSPSPAVPEKPKPRKLPRLYVLVGMIASGKSKWARARANPPDGSPGALVICHDDLTQMLHGGTFRYERGLREPYRRMEESLAWAGLNAGRDVIVDRTHLTWESRLRWIRWLMNYRSLQAFDGEEPPISIVAVAFPIHDPEWHARRRFETDARGRSCGEWLRVAEHHHAQALAEPLTENEAFDEIVRVEGTP